MVLTIAYDCLPIMISLIKKKQINLFNLAMHMWHLFSFDILRLYIWWMLPWNKDCSSWHFKALHLVDDTMEQGVFLYLIAISSELYDAI